ncbi:hypothetical protein [Streptomyces sp. NPDC020489]|uniref:hypothetical protein n=1 Tax=Streptomyces sp. NPDC020489 TaxID=3365077 RepID=UPI0037AF6A8B
MRKLPALLSTVVMAAGLISLSTPSASAASSSGCEVDGSYGYWWGDWSSSTELDPLELHLYDTAADGHHPAIRLVTKTNGGSVKTWSWHHTYGGKGAADIWDTHASDPAGIAAVTVDVAIFEKDDWLVQDRCSWVYR